MGMVVAAPLVIAPKDKRKLRGWTRSTEIRAGLAQRARIVLMAGDGYSNSEIARTVGVSRPTVLHRRGRYEQGGRWPGWRIVHGRASRGR